MKKFKLVLESIQNLKLLCTGIEEHAFSHPSFMHTSLALPHVLLYCQSWREGRDGFHYVFVISAHDFAVPTFIYKVSGAFVMQVHNDVFLDDFSEHRVAQSGRCSSFITDEYFNNSIVEPDFQNTHQTV